MTSRNKMEHENLYKKIGDKNKGEHTEYKEKPPTGEDYEDQLFQEFKALIGQSILVVTEADQLNLFGQTFRPIFCGKIINVTQGDITLYPVNIKMVNAPFYQFPTPLSIPLEKIAHFTPNFDCNNRIPLT